MEINKNFAALLIIAILIIILVSTSIKIYNTHLDNEYKVVTKKICEATKKCFIDGKCEGKSIKIDTLTKEKYLEKIVDPKTKEYVNGNVVIYYENDECRVDIK